MGYDLDPLPGLDPGFRAGFIMGACCSVVLAVLIALVWWCL